MAGDTARLRGRFSQAPRGNKLIIFASVAVALGVAAMPLMNKKVYDTEQKMAQLRDGQVGAAEGLEPASQRWAACPGSPRLLARRRRRSSGAAAWDQPVVACA